VTNRADAQVVRLSMIYALLDRSRIIRAAHLRAAWALWRYAEDSARYIFGDSTGDPLADKVWAIILTGPVITKDIHDRTNRHHSPRDIARALDKLMSLKLVRCETIKTGGRPAQRWYAV